ncbi:MAG: hypothetical protein ACREJG_01705 [Candidatus Rokuibacteriota bacterium]
MMRTLAVALGTLGVLLAPGAAHGSDLVYRGKKAGEARGWLEHQGHQREIGVGDDVPGWGRVQHIDDHELVLEYHLTDEDKARLRTQGAAVVVDVIRTRVVREDVRLRVP